MIKLDSGNVLLTPSHRRQLTAWLRRSRRLGERLGNFILTITLRRTGRLYEARAAFTPSGQKSKVQSFDCRARQHDCLNAFRDLIRDLTVRLHDQCIRRACAV